MAKELKEICEKMPKVELHAHLNGSVTTEILESVGRKFGVFPAAETCLVQSSSGSRTLEECWVAFSRIHEVVRTPEILSFITEEVIDSFVRENVIYLEIRTSLKAIHEIRSKEEYISSVLRAIEKYDIDKILVKLIISIDRKMGAEDAEENVKIAIEYKQKYPDLIKGIDLSGNPMTGNMQWILPLLQKCREAGFPITCHLPEVQNEAQTKAILEFHPERVAHAQFVHPSTGGSEELWSIARRLMIPVEICITSNVIGGIAPSYEQHYIKQFHNGGIPYAICTDDTGVFGTTLSEEFKRVLSIIPLDAKQLQQISINSLTYSFCSAAEKEQLLQKIKSWWKSC